MRAEERRLQATLGTARGALERGSLRHALRKAWTAGQIAARLNDTHGLQAAIAIAKAIRERTEGREQADAETLERYCSHCLVDAEVGVRHSASPFARLLLPSGASRPVKTCPDCAETIQEAARVCRFCGYRFD